MRKRAKKVISIILTLVISLSALFAVPMTSNAISTNADLESYGLPFWADPENKLTAEDVRAFTGNQSKITMAGAVGVYKRSTGSDYYYLFLPSNADCSRLRIWFNADSVSVGGTTLQSGEETDVFRALDAGGIRKDYTLKINSNSYQLVAVKSGDVGTIYINTESGSIKSINNSSDHSVWESGSVLVVDDKGSVEYDGELEKFNGRGNATWEHNYKKPYSMKLAQSTSLLGLGKGKKWVLLANDVDKNSLIKDQLIYDFSKYIGLKYQPTCRPVDLYVNQQYYGSYQLCEKVEIKSTRIDVNDSYEALEIANGTVDAQTGAITPADFTKMNNFVTRVYDSNGVRQTATTGPNAYTHTIGCRKYSGTSNSALNTLTDLKDPDDITGGYVFELEISERWGDEDTGFCAYNRQGWVVKSHDYVSKNMAAYCYDLLYAMGSAVYNGGTVPSGSTTTTCSSLSNLSVAALGAKTITNPAPAEKYRGKRWSDILDADSAVNYYWTQELFKNLDSSTTSVYFYKDSDSIDSKVYAGPAWDFDEALCYDKSSYRWGMSLSDTDGWYAKNTRIYRWRTSDSSTSYSSDSQSPRGFYAALSTNCDDFDIMARNKWYSNIAPAIDVLLGNKTDPKGILKSTAEYADLIKKSGTMNNMRHDIDDSNDYNVSAVTNGINNWLSSRRTWINNQFGKMDISSCTVEDIPDYALTGKEIKPSVKITNNGVVLEKGSDYSVSYADNINAGTASVNISGLGYYEGTVTKNFTITPGSLLGSTVSIRESAYKGDVLIPTVINSDGNEITDFITYQWYADGEAIPSATDREYTVSESDQGKVITLKITGDGENLDVLTITSNPCTVYEGEKPENYTETLAAWKYDYNTDSSDIINAGEDEETYYYNATSGQSAEGAKLIGSVDAQSSAKIKWSGIGEEYSGGSASGKAQVPIMGTSKSNNIAWGEYPYFEVSLSTKKYENIAFSVMLGGSKKGPRDWKLQYSLDGKNFTDIAGAAYSITNNKAMQQAFNNVMLPAECSDKSVVYIRAVASEDVAINGINAIVGEVSGDAAINNAIVRGNKISAITSLDAPVISSTSKFENSATILDTDRISIKDMNGGADVYYSIGNGEYQLYEGAFNPFGKNAKAGDSVAVSTYSRFNEVYSETTSQTFTYAGDNINQFSFETYSDNVFEGAVFSNGGAFDKSAKMTAYTDGKSLYVPLWNDEKGAYSIAPDDGAKWSEDSGFAFEVSTSGYKNISFSARAFTTNLGPMSVFLQYSLDGSEWKNAVEYMDLRADGILHQAFDRILLPAECENRAKIYIRIATVENLTYSNEALHNNLSKGNLYVNDIFISGDENGDIKMPYTNKTTDRFGDNTPIKYYSADKLEMFYTVTDAKGAIVLSGKYNENGISIPNAAEFSKTDTGAYKISVRAGDDDDSSITNTRSYYYKGDKLAEFDFDSKNNLLADYLDFSSTEVTNNDGEMAATLSFLPNGVNKTALSYGDKYGIKASYTEENQFAASKVLDNPNENGYYLIQTSTAGYQNITFGAEQICSNKAPRDWGIAYSTDGTSYTYVANSNVRALSNDAFDSTVETYNNFVLPSECDNQDNLYIKVFINGGESVDATELADVTKGNTGINNIEICGVEIPKEVEVTVNTYLLRSETEVDMNCAVPATISMSDTALSENTANAVLTLIKGNRYTISVSANANTFAREVTFTAEKDLVLDIGIIALDLNSDGIINAKDYAKIMRITNDSQNKAYSDAFKNFINAKSDGFTY